jgi:prepilin-type N-terminal cleavage/methylation domain-containing protein
MNSLKTSTHNQKGFTMIEMLMVMAVIAFTVAISIFMSGDFFISNSFESTVSAYGVSLQRARSQAVNNMNGNTHGVKVVDGDFIIFEGTNYAGSTNRQTIKGNSDFTFTLGADDAPEIIFEQLTGNAKYGGSPLDDDIVISDGFKTSLITINPQGRIDF